MAINLNGGEGVTLTYTGTADSGKTVPAAMGETTMVMALSANATLAPDTTVKAHGTQSMKITPVAAGPAYVRTPSANGTTGVAQGACDFLYRIPTLSAPPSGSEFYLIQAVGTNGGTLYSASWPATGFLRQRDGSGTATTGNQAFNPSAAFLRLSMVVSINTGTPASSTCHISAYPLDSGTASIDLGTLSKAPVTTGVLLDYFKIGRCNTDSDTTAFNEDDVRWDYAATDVMPVSSPQSIAGVVTPSGYPATTEITLTLTASGYTPSSYQGTWAGVAWGPQASNIVKHTDPADKVGQTVSWTATGNP